MNSIPAFLESVWKNPVPAHPAQYDVVVPRHYYQSTRQTLRMCPFLFQDLVCASFPSFEPSYFHVRIFSREKKIVPAHSNPSWLVPSWEPILTIGVFHFFGWVSLLRGVVGMRGEETDNPWPGKGQGFSMDLEGVFFQLADCHGGK